MIPPVFKIAIWDGQQVIDSGMSDKAPMPEPNRGQTMILLTDEFPNAPRDPDRLYVVARDPGGQTSPTRRNCARLGSWAGATERLSCSAT